jgi:hypothetical protein
VPLKTLPPGLAKRLIQHDADILSPAQEARAVFHETTPCPRCKGALHPALHSPYAFTQGEVLPRTLARCVDCELLLDPATGLILETGNPGKIEQPLPIVRPDEG